MSGDHNMYQKSKSYLDDFECPRCGHCCQSEVSLRAMKRIKTWSERCEEHPDYQTGMISERMIQERMREEIDELRQALETDLARVGEVGVWGEWQGLTDEEHDRIKHNYHNMTWTLEMFARAIEAKLKEKNT